MEACFNVDKRKSRKILYLIVKHVTGCCKEEKKPFTRSTGYFVSVGLFLQQPLCLARPYLPCHLTKTKMMTSPSPVLRTVPLPWSSLGTYIITGVDSNKVGFQCIT